MLLKKSSTLINNKKVKELRLPVALAQVKIGNTCEKLLN